MPKHDHAVELTLRYLAEIERHLQITWNDQNEPICIIDWISDESVLLLSDKLAELLGSALSQQARDVTVEYGKEHIQTVGFGHAPNFDQFVKLGFIYGDRVVLWDVISSRLLVKKDSGAQLKSVLAQIACELLLLRPVVERGALVILSHPITWSKIAAELEIDLRAHGNKSTATLGISMALAAIEEGMPLHPYTLLVAGPQPSAIGQINQHYSELYSPENYIFQKAISSLLRDQRVAYLQGISAADFHDIVAKHGELQRALRKHFIPNLTGLSPQQATLEICNLTDDIIGLIDKRNTAFIDYKAEGVDASVKFLLTSLTSISLDLPLLSALALAGTLAIPLSTAIRKWAKKPEKNIIVQAFQAMMEAENVPHGQHYSTMTEPVVENGQIHPDIQSLYVQFMSFHWTEERYHFLETLSREVARALLKTLGPDDLEIIVNHRRFQNDYIGDYLVYLSQLDQDIYWEHLGKTFESDEGLLIYDDSAHIDAMVYGDMPMKAWMQLLDSLSRVHFDELANKKYGYPLQCFPDILHFQTDSAMDCIAKQDAFIVWFKSPDGLQEEAKLHFLLEAYSGIIPKWFADKIAQA